MWSMVKWVWCVVWLCVDCGVFLLLLPVGICVVKRWIYQRWRIFVAHMGNTCEILKNKIELASCLSRTWHSEALIFFFFLKSRV